MVETHSLDCDVLVAGGGISGVMAALAAARCGSRVILCQDRPVLGGNASSEVRMHIVGADASGGRGKELEVEAREGGILEELRLETTVRNPQRSASVFDLILYDACRSEPHLVLMLNTAVTAAEMDGDRIARAIAERPSTEDRFCIAASVFVDCTGDGRLGAEAGARFRRGREGNDEFGEPLAQARPDGKSLGSSLLFTAREHDRPMPFVAPPWVRKFTEDDLTLRSHGAASGLEYGYWWVEWGGTLDTIKDNETIRDELLAIMLGVWDHIKNGGDHGAECWALDWFGFLPGKRESRRFIGQHVLSEKDLMDAVPFEDAIAYGGWPIDIHPPGGIDASHKKGCTATHVPRLFDIPLRVCVSGNVSNLMFAGRNISATHVAFASTRVMATCGAVGQGVGTAAAYAAQHAVPPARLAETPAAILAIQQRLLQDDAYLTGVGNEDPSDLAREATVAASGALPDAPAANVLTGQTRSVHGERGAPSARAKPGLHRWMSLPITEEQPASLELSWEKPVRVSTIQVVFDTGLHRVLTLSHSDGYTKNQMCWGQPQPETVRDYSIEAQLDHGAWQSIVQAEGNYQRVNRHRLPRPVTTTALRFRIHATNGIDHARVSEVRVYDDEQTWTVPAPGEDDL